MASCTSKSHHSLFIHTIFPSMKLHLEHTVGCPLSAGTGDLRQLSWLLLLAYLLFLFLPPSHLPLLFLFFLLFLLSFLLLLFFILTLSQRPEVHVNTVCACLFFLIPALNLGGRISCGLFTIPSSPVTSLGSPS